MTAHVIVLGSTGSIGTQALEVIAEHRDRFDVAGLAAGGGRVDELAAQARELGLNSEALAAADERAASQLAGEFGEGVAAGPDAAAELVSRLAGPGDIVLNAMVGSRGLKATLQALSSGARLALANKESLVAGGRLVLDAAAPGQLVPVDSEHSAMAQALRSGRADEVDRLVLTASGGPFRGRTRDELWSVTPEQAAAHPTWRMGEMNTLNSATLVNKGLELIEASYLFGVDPARIEVTVHPRSVVHSAVTYRDGSTIAQASPATMRLPIAVALGWPERLPGACAPLDFTRATEWSFGPVDDETFPAVELARQAVASGTSLPAVYNAANEEAAAAFLAGRIAFPAIVDTVAAALDELSGSVGKAGSVEEVLAIEGEARSLARRLLRDAPAPSGGRG